MFSKIGKKGTLNILNILFYYKLGRFERKQPLKIFKFSVALLIFLTKIQEEMNKERKEVVQRVSPPFLLPPFLPLTVVQSIVTGEILLAAKILYN